MHRFALLFVVSILLGACQCGRTALRTLEPCETNNDCLSTELCLAKVCTPAGVDAGVDAGGIDAGARIECSNRPANSASVTYAASNGTSATCDFSNVVCITGYEWNRATAAASAACTQRTFACQQAQSGYDCGNGRSSTMFMVNSLTDAIASCRAWVSSGNDFCNVRSQSPRATDSVECVMSGRKWVSSNNCCVNKECQVGQFGDGATPCAQCTNKPANAVSVTYGTSGCGQNACDYATVTCAGGLTWNQDPTVAGAACR